MSYLWEHYDINNNYKLAVKNFCPYTEIFNIINGEAKVNILFRFEEVFRNISDTILDGLRSEDEALTEYMNVLFHMLANIDMYSGITKRDIYLIRILKEMEEGKYGIDQELLYKLLFVHKYKLLSYYFSKHCTGNKQCYFFDFLAEVFGAKLYYSEFKDTYIIQIRNNSDDMFGEGDKYSANELFDLAKDILCDFWLEVEVYWGKPIAILGQYIEVDGVQIV